MNGTTTGESIKGIIRGLKPGMTFRVPLDKPGRLASIRSMVSDLNKHYRNLPSEYTCECDNPDEVVITAVVRTKNLPSK